MAQPPPSEPNAEAQPNQISLGLVTIRVDNKSFLNSPAYIKETVSGLSRVAGYSVTPIDDAKTKLETAVFSNTVVRTKKLQTLDTAISDGEELIYTDPKKAVAVFQESHEKLLSLIKKSSMSDVLRRMLFRVHLLLARALVDNGDSKSAEKVLDMNVSVFGDQALDSDVYHPQIVELHNRSRKRFQNLKKGAITLESNPDGARVIINGKDIGLVTPALVEGLAPGEHHVQLVTDRAKSRVHRVRVASETPQKKTISLSCDGALSWASDGIAFFFENSKQLTDEIGSCSAHLSQTLEVDYVLAIGLVPHPKGAAFIGYIVEATTGRLLQSESILVDPDAVDEDAVERMIEGLSGSDDGSSESGTGVYFGTQGPWYKQWPGWVLTGAGVVSTALAISYFSDFNSQKANAEDPNYRSTDPDTGNTARDAAANQALKSQRAAWTTGVIGVLSLAGAATFFAMHHMHQDNASALHSEETGFNWALLPSFGPGGLRFGVGASF